MGFSWSSSGHCSIAAEIIVNVASTSEGVACTVADEKKYGFNMPTLLYVNLAALSADDNIDIYDMDI